MAKRDEILDELIYEFVYEVLPENSVTRTDLSEVYFRHLAQAVSALT
jgi:hypothetical protein